MRTLAGYDYRILDKRREIGAVLRTRQEWQQLIREGIAAGGYRKVEDGETLVYNKHGRIEFEIYANVHV